MWYVVLSKPIGSHERTLDSVRENLAWLKEHHEAGDALFTGPTTEGVGIWVLKANDRDEAQALVNSHPWVKAGLRDVSEMYEWTVQQAMGVGRFELPQLSG
jgi:uncharacterized protein YciI